MHVLSAALLVTCSLCVAARPALAQHIPTLDGFGAASSPHEFQSRFRGATCTKTQFSMGTQKAESVICTAKGSYLVRAAEYKASFSDGGMSGIAVHVVAANDALRLAPDLVRSLSASYGAPTENYLASPEKMKNEGGVAARWVFRPTALVTLTLCGPSLYVNRTGCPDNRIIVDLMYNRRQ